MKTLLTLAAIALPTALLAEAKNDNALYEPTPPADSAFVRVINAAPDTATLKADVAGAAYGDVAYPGISDYHVVKAGSQKVNLGSLNQSLAVAAGKYYTIVLAPSAKGDQIVVVDDAPMDQPSKAYVYFYNFSDAPKASLNAPQHKTDILKDVAAGKGDHKEINALTLDMAVTVDGTPVQEFKNVALKRRAGISFLLSGEGASKKAIEADNHIKQ